MKRSIIIILLLFLGTTIYSQNMHIDSLKRCIISQTNDTNKLIILKKISDLFLVNNPDSSMHYANKMLGIATEKQLLYYISDAYDLIANVYEQEGDLVKCVIAIDSAKYYAELINDTLGIIFFTNNKAGLYIKMGKYFEALQTFEEVTQISERANDPAGTAAALNNMGVVYHYLGDDQTSLNYFIQAYQLRIDNNIIQKLAYSLNNIGAVYSKYGNYNEAIEYHKKAMQAAFDHNDDYNYLVALLNLGLDYHFLNEYDRTLAYYSSALKEAKKQGNKTLQSHAMERMSSVYTDMDSIEKAKPLLEGALKISRDIGNKYDNAAFCNSLGVIYLKEKNYAVALQLFKEALLISKQISASKIEVDIYKSLTAYYYSTNNSKDAFAYQKLFDIKRDSLYKAETDLKIANLKNRFELNLKLDELEQKELELSSTRKVSGTRLKTIYIFGFGGFALLILVIYILMLYRRIMVKNQIISQNEEKVRQLLEKEKELGKIKTQLISTVSHEFRTPMAIISSNAQLLRDFQKSMDEEMRQETLKYIQSGIENMIAMMKNFEVLDQKTILEFKPEQINFRQLLNNIVDELQSITKYKGRIRIIDKLTAEDFVLDKGLITHIVRNLIINALKFSGNKTIGLQFYNENSKVVIEVTDNGIGMSKPDMKNIFKDFHRGANVKNIIGTGVGMSVVKRCVDLHNGSIVVSSKIDRGTNIKVSLPVE